MLHDMLNILREDINLREGFRFFVQVMVEAIRYQHSAVVKEIPVSAKSGEENIAGIVELLRQWFVDFSAPEYVTTLIDSSSN